MHPPFASPGSRPGTARRAHVESLPSIQEFLDELPSIEDFIDHSPLELPPITEFVADDFSVDEPVAQHHDADWFNQEADDADGWAASGWQDFDWTRAASLGIASQAENEANSAWDTIDWSEPATARSTPSTERNNTAPPSADEVARALDGIARRIRSGELLIDQLKGTPPEAAMAAALAALLRTRD